MQYIKNTNRDKKIVTTFLIFVLVISFICTSAYEIYGSIQIQDITETTSLNTEGNDGVMPAAYTGYHTESHGSHARDLNYVLVTGNDGRCAMCGNNTLSYRHYYYIFACNGRDYRYYIYAEYPICNAGCGMANMAEFLTVTPEPWTILHNEIGLNTYYTHDRFLNTYLPAALTCPGYTAADKHTVNYHANGGTGGPTDSFTKTYGINPAISTAKPTRTGYTFANWNSKSDGSGFTISSGGNYTHDQNGGTITLYAQWIRNTYSVTYHANGGTTTAPSGSYYYGSTVDLSPIASKEGYIFVGWSTNPNAKKPLNSLSMPDLATSTNTDYSADWELTLYAIYSIPVSDVANHTYPAYNLVKSEEVYMVVWKTDNIADFRTYPLTYTKDVNLMTYEYSLDSTDLFAFVETFPYYYQVIAFDNAGNHSILYEGSSDGSPVPDFPVPQKYLQTVKHFKKNVITGDWVWFDTTIELKMEGEDFTPAAITPPAGFAFSSIDTPSYVVTSAVTSNAYYEPIPYTLHFDANGGTCSITSKSVTYEDYYGKLPTPERTGYSFIGWYTTPMDGDRISSSCRYTQTSDSTLYAHWEINSYTLTYDYWTNGGTGVSLEQASHNYGSTIDLSTITAQKSGTNLNDWKFVGWNTDPNAMVGLTQFTVSAKDEILYAIYQKDIIVTLVMRDDTNIVTKTLSSTIYNNEAAADFSISQETLWTGWELLGWTIETEATETPMIGAESISTFSDSITLYALYSTDITLSYDTNGSAQFFSSQTKKRFYNASGNYKNPTFITAKAPILDKHTFVQWDSIDENGVVKTHYPANETISPETDLHLIAKWDQHPEIEAYNRYFTLEQAKNGEITKDVLLEKVTATDREDGVLENGTDVIILNMNQYDFTNSGDFIITYCATDTFGNVSEKSVHIYIVDTSTTQSTHSNYIRFINSDFWYYEHLSIPKEYGGLENTSIWHTNPSYKDLLNSTLQKTEPKKIYTFSSKTK